LIVEAGSKLTLSRGLRGLGIWIARRVNLAASTRGRVIADRYHQRALTTPRAVRHAIVYVLQNHLHHRSPNLPNLPTLPTLPNLVDECSSARWFTGWAARLPPPDTPPPVRPAQTWLGRIG